MTRDEYQEEAILWLNRQRQYFEIYKVTGDPDERRLWDTKIAHAAKMMDFCASIAGLESIEELEE